MDDLPSCNIASGFVQAYRIAKKVIHNNGDNTFLNGSNIYAGVHQDFEPTSQGLKRKDKLSLPPPPSYKVKQLFIKKNLFHYPLKKKRIKLYLYFFKKKNFIKSLGFYTNLFYIFCIAL